MSETAFILIVEDDPGHAETLAAGLKDQGHLCLVVQSAEEALDSVRARRPDVIVADDRIAGRADGLQTLREAKQLAPDVEVIVMTTDGRAGLTAEAEAAAREISVFEWITRPTDFEAVRTIVARAADRALRNRGRRALREHADRRLEFGGLITANDQVIRLLGRVRKIANSKLTLLVLGESGTGKELVARALHNHSPRKGKGYRAINCAGLNENLLESELFGHVKGAFTGATSDRKGLFEVVDGGTLFLDEVGDMPMPMQAKLLRTLENGEIIPVGSNDLRKVDVRVVAATRRDLREMVDRGQFRDDLFYRLNGAQIRLPPLRERREDIPLLIDHFLMEAAETHGKKVESISPEAVRRLSGHQWPGNVRELRSVVDQMVVLADGPHLDLQDLPEHLRGSTDIVLASAPGTAGLTMEQVEKMHIASTLKLTGGNREKTAKLLGIGARTLYRKLREYGLQ